ncbi:MAG: GvpL/GvpF family gas vesicle protein [Vicinamibacterales bacterium]
MSLRVYAVVPGATRAPGGPLRLVTVGRLAAAVERGRVRAATPRNLVAYDRQMRVLADRAAAILPARFNTIVADEEEIATILRLRRARLGAALKNVRGRVQMTVRVPVAPVGRALPGSAPGTAYLRSRRIPELDPLRAATKRWVRDERIEPREGLASIYHLVPGTAVDAYRDALIAAADAAGVRLVVTGPFPPYAFAQGW